MRKIIIGFGLVALFTLGVAAPAQAGTANFVYTLTSSDALAPGPYNTCSTVADGAYYYQMRTVSVSASGSYHFTTSPSGGFVALYSQPFDPGAPTAHCIEAQSAGNATLTVNTRYWLYLSTNYPETLGTFRMMVSGPGTMTETQTTTTDLSSAPNPATLGSSVILTATVTGNLPSGTVEFFDGAALIGASSVISGKATATYGPSTAGTHLITAAYSGDAANFASTSSATSLLVDPAATTTNVGASPNPATVGGTVTLTATIAGILPTGTVEFFDGVTSLGSGTVASGVATLDYVPTDVGPAAITAVYSGDTQNLGSSGTVGVSVEAASTSTSLIAAPNPADLGDTVSLSASVTGSLPTGTVEFFDGATSLGTGMVDAGGSAALDYVPATTGASSVTAVYSGDARNLASTSSPTTVTVVRATTSTGLSISPDTIALGTSSTLTATVAGNAPTGAVEFFADSVSIGTGTITGGAASITYTPDALGAASISAAYPGDAGNAPSSSASATLTITPAVTTVAIGTTPFLVTAGTPIDLAATVAGHDPTGTVEFFDGTTSLGIAALSGGLATLSYSPLDAGPLSITASYSGDSENLASTSAAVSVMVAVAQVDPARTDPDLASTGADSGSLIASALLLLLAGTVLWLVRRRGWTTHPG